MGTKFNMGSQTLQTLSQQTDGAHADLGGQVKAFIAAAEPLMKKFEGQGKVAFDRFKENANSIIGELNSSLAAINEGQRGMDRAFQTGDQQAADESQRADSGANYSAASFRSKA